MKADVGTDPQIPNHALQSCPTFDTDVSDMAQSSGCPQEALGTGGDAVPECRLCLTQHTENLAMPGMQRSENKEGCSRLAGWLSGWLALLQHHGHLTYLTLLWYPCDRQSPSFSTSLFYEGSHGQGLTAHGTRTTICALQGQHMERTSLTSRW